LPASTNTGLRLIFQRLSLSVAGAAVGYFIVTRQLTGSFTGGHEEPPPPPPLSVRIPLTLRFF
jgi:hypothetical protein